jgi:DNA-directed RNA polymerase III subunit RPC11
MLTFCPTCGNLLAIEKHEREEEEEEEDEEDEDENGAEEQNRLGLACKTCAYKYKLKSTAWSRTIVPNVRKRVDDVLGGDDAWKNVDRTLARCPKCAFDEAYFLMVQTRSADEPMTQFFRCVQCSNQWKEG